MDGVELVCGRGTCHACICQGQLATSTCSPASINYTLVLTMLLGLLWTTFIASGMVHTTVAGAVSKWWLLRPYESSSLLVRKSFENAAYKSFSSICFGSLISSIVKSVWLVFYLVRTLIFPRRKERLSTWSLQYCLLVVLERILYSLNSLYSYFNRYALSFIAIHNLRFVQAAK